MEPLNEQQLNACDVEKTKLTAIIISLMTSANKYPSESGDIRKNAHGENADCGPQVTVTIEGDITMRTILLAGLVATGIGLAGTSGVSAVPINGTVIGDAATATDHVTQVQWGHWRWGSRGGHWRWGSRGGHWRWGSRGRRY